jgi:uncharacterized membrane protein (DUF4010 family)
MRRIIITCVLLAATAIVALAATRYVLVGQWQGTTGIQNTQAFGVRTASWAITYSLRAADKDLSPMLILYVYRHTANGKYMLVDTFLASGACSGTTYVHAGAGRYYLTIQALSCVWTCAAYECWEQ